MPINPLYNTNNSPNNSTQPTKAVNRQGVYVPHTHNTYDMSYPHRTTQHFGLYEPFFAMEGLPRDVIPMSCEQDVQTLPMISAFKDQVTLNKDYFLVPNQAIQPNTWEYIYKHPAQGDDVPFDAYNVFPLFDQERTVGYLDDLFEYLNNRIVGGEYEQALQTLLCLELFCSSGSLLYKLGYHINPIIVREDLVEMSFDNYFDYFVNSITDYNIQIDTDSVKADYGSNIIDKYQFISMIRTYGSSCSFGVSIDEGLMGFEFRGLPTKQEDESNMYFNMDRVCAYQLSCWQYYVNPQVDFMYNAQLWRDNIVNLIANATGINSVPTFLINGITIPYDRCSLKTYQLIWDSFLIGGVSSTFYDCLSALFGYNEQLKFGDYLTDSRTRPLANGNDIVSLVDGGVSVIDMSKSIIWQRFRNAVIKLGNNFEDYLKGIFGSAPSPDYHFPKFIVHKEVSIGGFDTARTTADNQGLVAHQLRTVEETTDFAVEIDMPCVLIGISYFSVPVTYMQTKDRQFFHKDRFDFFNPMMQQIGDQVVFNNERTDLRPSDEIFGYQSRYNEYKQRLPVASGGFVTGNQLSSWTFIVDSIFKPNVNLQIANTQSPDYIRHHDYEFNRFFETMGGTSLANGFHFIVVYNNKVVCNRPLEVNPSTL